MSRSININKLEEGFIIKDLETNMEYATTKDRLVQKVKALLGITHKKKPVPVPEPEKPPEHTRPITETGFVLKEITFPNNLTGLQEQEHKQGKMTWCLSIDSSAIRIKREGYDTSVDLLVTDLKYLYDNPITAKGIIKKFGEDVYENKAVVLRAFLREIPYPKIFPEIPEVPEENGSEDGTCDDITFDNCVNNEPENCKFCVKQSRFQDKNKLAAKKPAPPQMKINMGV